ncbi:MAG: hypothetical protein KBT02_12615 [Treponema sp.]|nr:hypothetical protein [Candidatus Treponema caballi]
MSSTENFIEPEQEISITAILALCFKNIKGIVIAMLIGATILGGYKSYSQYENNQEPSYIEEYNLKTDSLNANLSSYQFQSTVQSRYNETAPLMKINPQETVLTTVTFAISTEKEQYANINGYDVPISAIVANKYFDYWKSINLAEVLGNPEFQDSWIRELISLNAVTTNPLTQSSKDTISTQNAYKTYFFNLIIYSSTISEGKQYADALDSFFQNSNQYIAYLSYPHTIERVLIQQVTEQNTSIASAQHKHTSDYATTLTNIIKSKAELDEHIKNAPRNYIKTFTKWFVIGAFAGAFLYCLYLLIDFIGKMPVTSSFEFDSYTHLPFFGMLYTKRTWEEKLCFKLMNERSFSSPESADDFITQNARTKFEDGSKVLVISTFFKTEGGSVATVLNALEAAGISASFAGNALTSSAVLEQIVNCDHVLFLEKTWVSRWQNINTELKTIQNYNKKAAGFILA